jgi:ParB family transcriptional regulator, chromosome partitioning protein
MSKTKKPATSEQATEAGSSPARAVRLGFYDVPHEYIRPSPNSLRKSFDAAALLQLAVSIKAHGILSPIIVRPVGEVDGHPVFELVAGERRWTAARQAGLDRITCSVRVLTDLEVIELQLAENSQRVDLTPSEYAGVFHRLQIAEGK